MADVEQQQEGQKTVVAFIAGLLIGGLLVWVFSSSPEPTGTVGDNGDDTATEEPTNDTGDDTQTDPSDDQTSTNDDTTAGNGDPSGEVGEGSLTISDQAAGSAVVIEDVTYPTSDGWIAVRDYENGVGGNILGAARYSVGQGLHPEEVRLLRNTEAGTTYQVVFFNENGDRVFDLGDDELLSVGATTFTAQ